MLFLTKIAALAGLAALGLAAAAAPAQAAAAAVHLQLLPSYQLRARPATAADAQHVPSRTSALSNVDLDRDRAGRAPASPTPRFIGTSPPGRPSTSDADFPFPPSFGDQPENTQFDPQNGPLPFVAVRHAAPAATASPTASRSPRPTTPTAPPPPCPSPARWPCSPPAWACSALSACAASARARLARPPGPRLPNSGPGAIVFCAPPCYNNPIVERGRFLTVSFLSAPALETWHHRRGHTPLPIGRKIMPSTAITRPYEAVYILDPDSGEEQIAAVTGRYQGAGRVQRRPGTEG